MTTGNDWEPLVVDTKISILVAFGVLNSPLPETKISKFNKQHISETEYTTYFVKVFLKIGLWRVTFQSIIVVV